MSTSRRASPIAIGVLRTTPFMAAGILSIFLFYLQTTIGWNWDWDQLGMLVLIFSLLSWTVFFAVSRQLPYSKKTVIDDLLLSALFYLGPKYRINIMELTSPVDNAFSAYFRITYGHGYNNPAIYREKITMNIPGASTAYQHRKVVYLASKGLQATIDPEVKHLWSAPIIGQRGNSVAVLNIDNIGDDTLNADVIEQTKKLIEQLSNLIGFYWEIPA